VIEEGKIKGIKERRNGLNEGQSGEIGIFLH